MSREPEKETVKTDTSYDSCTSRLSRAITKFDSQHATSSQQQIQTPEAAARAYAETPSFSRSFSSMNHDRSNTPIASNQQSNSGATG